MNNDESDILITQKQIDNYEKQNGLQKTMSAIHIWSFGVGACIMAIFFGWNQGIKESGVNNYIFAVLIVTIFYQILIMSFKKLAISLPYSGGPYSYVRKVMGTFEGSLTGFLALVQLICSSVAILSIINSYVISIYPTVDSKYIVIALVCFLIIIDILGMKLTSTIQLILVVVALSGLIIFLIAVEDSISFTNFIIPKIDLNEFEFNKIIKVVPYAIWLYFGIEGITFFSEETKNPNRNLTIGFIATIVTTSILNLLIIGICVLNFSSSEFITSKYPLIFLLKHVQPYDDVVLEVFRFTILVSMISALHSRMVAYSRLAFSLGRAGYIPKIFSNINSKMKTPLYSSIILGFLILILSIYINIYKLIYIANISAIGMYILVIISLIKSTKKNCVNNINKLLCYMISSCLLVFLIILEFYFIKKSEINITILIMLLVFILYYYIFAKYFIVPTAPEEMEAKAEKIIIK